MYTLAVSADSETETWLFFATYEDVLAKGPFQIALLLDAPVATVVLLTRCRQQHDRIICGFVWQIKSL
jgi:hypothetical protein